MSTKSKDVTITHVGDYKLDFPMKLVYIETPKGENKFEFQANDGTEFAPKQSYPISFKSDFWLCAYQCPQEFWAAVVKEAKIKELKENPSRSKGNRRPVERVSWDDIQIFLRALNGLREKGRLKIKDDIVIEDGFEFQLPAEAEWEYAGLAGQNTVYAGSNILEDVGWYERNSNGQTMPVGLKRPNEKGLYDMSGNVYEWCKNDYNQPESLDLGKDEEFKALRGGDFFLWAAGCRLRSRFGGRPDGRRGLIGFRFGLFPVQKP